MLPIARRDVERLQQIIAIQPKLLDIDAPVRAQRGLLHRAILDEALTWLEIHGDRPDAVAHWRELKIQAQASRRSRRWGTKRPLTSPSGGGGGGDGAAATTARDPEELAPLAAVCARQ